MHSEEFKKEIFSLKNKLYRFSRWIVLENDVAEDLVQDLFLKLWSMRSELRRYQNLEAFAMKMIKNMALNYLKKTKKVTSDFSALHSDLPNPYEKMVTKDKMEIMEKIIFELPEQQRMVVQLRDIEGYEVEEIASIAELTENNIWVILSQARKNIRVAYLKLEDNEQRKY